jgi:hypothetical protein
MAKSEPGDHFLAWSLSHKHGGGDNAQTIIKSMQTNTKSLLRIELTQHNPLLLL